MTLEEAQQIAREIARGARNFECDSCVREIAKRLGKDFPAMVEKIRCADDSAPIMLVEHDLLISATGMHAGIRIGELVFDNHHPEGVVHSAWASRFEAGTGAAFDRETRPLADFFGARFATRRFNRWLAQKRPRGE